MYQVIRKVTNKGVKEINTIDDLREEYPEVKLVLAHGHDEVIGCSCHISAPCSYCIAQTEYCTKCGWSAEEEQHSYEEGFSKRYCANAAPYVCKTDEQLFKELPDGEFGYIYVVSGAPSVTRLRGKHNGLTRKEIFRRVGCADKYSMARMKMYDDKEFELTYFND